MHPGFIRKLRTYYRLGLLNVANVALYRLAKKSGYYSRTNPIGKQLLGPFLYEEPAPEKLNHLPDLVYFSYHLHPFPIGNRWFDNPWTRNQHKRDKRHWSRIPDFASETGDIKTVWEASRFDWAPQWAWSFRHENRKSLDRQLEFVVRDWCEQNPPNEGVNWKCGQETSFRAINLLLAAKILGKPYRQPEDGLVVFLAAHAKRIVLTLRFAMAQDNNHGTSEACALFVIGLYLNENGGSAHKNQARLYMRLGRRWIENRVKRLILRDGSFSQHSVTYHRLVLDTLSLCELTRSEYNEAHFSKTFYKLTILATEWLHTMTDPSSGDAPNLGSNDGAYLFNLSGKPYRDFRPSVELAMAIFLGKSAYDTVSHPFFELFDIGKPASKYDHTDECKLFESGGYGVIKRDRMNLVFRLPRYAFRPAQCDCLHLDVFYKGMNILRDAGSYSYNSSDKQLSDFFVGTQSHNTICFDNRNQMPRISRFLFGEWLNTKDIKLDQDNLRITSSYIDYLGARHSRSVSASKNSILVQDSISGFHDRAELRWRLMPADWRLINNKLVCDIATLTVDADVDCDTRVEYEAESLHYLQLTKVPVLVATVTQRCTLTTTICMSPDNQQ